MGSDRSSSTGSTRSSAFSDQDVTKTPTEKIESNDKIENIEPKSFTFDASNLEPEIARFYRRQQKGIYINPRRRKQLEKLVKSSKDVSSREYQEMAWFRLRKGIHGLINRVTISNIKTILVSMFEVNLVRGRGVLVKALMEAQMTSPTFTHIYAALVAVLNTKLPEIGELLVSRVVIRFRQAFERNHKPWATALVKFIAHLVNQQVTHEILALQVIQLLLVNPTDDSVELAIEFTKEVGQFLLDVIPRGLHGTFEQLRTILQEGSIHERVQYLIEDLFTLRKANFEGYPMIIRPQLDLVEADDQITHSIQLDDDLDPRDDLDTFQMDPHYAKNEKQWKAIQSEILGADDDSSSTDSGNESDSSSNGDDSDSSSSNSGSSQSSSKSSDGNEGMDEEVVASSAPTEMPVIQDFSESDLVEIRKKIYLVIMSSLTFEEGVHKLLQLHLPAGLESELINMIVECCSQEKAYSVYYGNLAERFCLLSRAYQVACAECFKEHYETIHRLDTNKLRNVAMLFSHVLQNDALPWTVFENIAINERDTTSAGRIFVKVLFNDISENIGIAKLRDRVMDPSMASVFARMLPKDNPQDTIFSINYFTAIGLGALTDDMREYLKTAPRPQAVRNTNYDSDSSSSCSSSSSSSGSSSGSSSSSSSKSSRSSSSTTSRRGTRRRRSSSSSDTASITRKRQARSVSSASSASDIDRKKMRKD